MDMSVLCDDVVVQRANPESKGRYIRELINGHSKVAAMEMSLRNRSNDQRHIMLYLHFKL